MAVYNQRYDYEWVDVTEMKTFVCCSCGLVHHLEHCILEGRILRRAARDNRLTAARRRSMKVRKEGLWE